MLATPTRAARTAAATAAMLILATACSRAEDAPAAAATTPASTTPAGAAPSSTGPGPSGTAEPTPGPTSTPAAGAGVPGSRASQVADLQQAKCGPFLDAVGSELGQPVAVSQLDPRQSCVSSREPGDEVVLVSLALSPRTAGSSCEPVAMTGPSSLTVDGGGTPEIRTVEVDGVTGTLITTPPAGGEVVACTDDVVYDIQYLASTGRMPDFAALLRAALDA